MKPASKQITDATGQKFHIHPKSACKGHPCVFHNPSDHKMKDWPKVLRLDWGPPFVERQCPHGIGHPDPDSLAYLKSQGHESMDVHGCDGCCH